MLELRFEGRQMPSGLKTEKKQAGTVSSRHSSHVAGGSALLGWDRKSVGRMRLRRQP